jgi:hypothetical protein
MSFSSAQLLAAAMAFAALAFLVHRLRVALHANRFLPITPQMKGQLSNLRPGGRDSGEPLVDLHHARTVQRGLANALLLSWMAISGLIALALALAGLKLLAAG